MIDASKFGTPSTQDAAEALEDVEAKGNVLVLVGDDESGCALSFRNIGRVLVLPARQAGVADLVGAAHLVLSDAALEELAGSEQNGEGR
jgi:ribosomal protein L4